MRPATSPSKLKMSLNARCLLVLLVPCFLGGTTFAMPVHSNSKTAPPSYITTRNVASLATQLTINDCAAMVVNITSNLYLPGCGQPTLTKSGGDDGGYGCAWPAPRCPAGWAIIDSHNNQEAGASDGSAVCVTETVCRSP